jgi:hypothetical protein
MADRDHEREDEALQAPPRLVAALEHVQPERIFIPPTLDEAVLRAARRHLCAPEEPRPRWFRWMPWVAATAAVVLLVVAPQFLTRPKVGPAAGATGPGKEVNRDGRVDILDAFALARQLKSGGTTSPQLDVNGDGVVDERDVATLAARAVRLEKGGRS